jgi:excisionase family DNA binding protein
MVAKKSIKHLKKSIENQPVGTKKIFSLSFNGNADTVPIPQKAFHILEQALKNMAEGTSFRLMQEDEMIGTQEAADLLKISRPHLVKLLESGEISFAKAGTHRRVSKKDVLDFDIKRKQTRKKNLDFLSKQAQELNLGYE